MKENGIEYTSLTNACAGESITILPLRGPGSSWYGKLFQEFDAQFHKKVNFLIQVIKQWAGPAEMTGQARNLNTYTNTHMHTQIRMYLYIIFPKKMKGRHEKCK